MLEIAHACQNSSFYMSENTGVYLQLQLANFRALSELEYGASESWLLVANTDCKTLYRAHLSALVSASENSALAKET